MRINIEQMKQASQVVAGQRQKKEQDTGFEDIISQMLTMTMKNMPLSGQTKEGNETLSDTASPMGQSMNSIKQSVWSTVIGFNQANDDMDEAITQATISLNQLEGSNIIHNITDGIVDQALGNIFNAEASENIPKTAEDSTSDLKSHMEPKLEPTADLTQNQLQTEDLKVDNGSVTQRATDYVYVKKAVDIKTITSYTSGLNDNQPQIGETSFIANDAVNNAKGNIVESLESNLAMKDDTIRIAATDNAEKSYESDFLVMKDGKPIKTPLDEGQLTQVTAMENRGKVINSSVKGEITGDEVGSLKLSKSMFKQGDFLQEEDWAKTEERIDISIPQNQMNLLKSGIDKIHISSKVATPISNLQEIEVKIAEKFTILQDGDHSTLKMKLKPETLGEIEVGFQMKDGHLSGEILVETISAKAALEGQMQNLKDRLRNQNIFLNEVNIGLQHNSQEQNQHRRPSYFQGGTKEQSFSEQAISQEELSKQQLYPQTLRGFYGTGIVGNSLDMLA